MPAILVTLIPLIIQEGIPFVLEVMKIWRKDPTRDKSLDPSTDEFIALLSSGLGKSAKEYGIKVQPVVVG